MLRCDPIPEHESLLWYQHAVGKEMKFLLRFLREIIQDKSGMPNNRFSAERTEGTYSNLKIQTAQLEDSGVYFCASSLTQCFRVMSFLCKTVPSPLSSQPTTAPNRRLSLCFLPQGREEGKNQYQQAFFKKMWMGTFVIWGVPGVPYTELNLSYLFFKCVCVILAENTECLLLAHLAALI